MDGLTGRRSAGPNQPFTLPIVHLPCPPALPTGIHPSLLQAPDAEVPASFLPLSLARLVDSLADVVAHYKLKEVLGLGAGVGGHVMAQLAAQQPAVREWHTPLVAAGCLSSRPGA